MAVLAAETGRRPVIVVVLAGRRLADVCWVTGRREAHPVVTEDRPAGLAALTGRWVTVAIGRRTADAIPGAVACSLVAAGGRPDIDGGRLVIDGGRPVVASGRPGVASGRPVVASGLPVAASGRPVVVDRSAFDGTAALTGPAVSGVRAAPGAAGRPAGPVAAAGILEAGRAVGCIMT